MTTRTYSAFRRYFHFPDSLCRPFPDKFCMTQRFQPSCLIATAGKPPFFSLANEYGIP